MRHELVQTLSYSGKTTGDSRQVTASLELLLESPRLKYPPTIRTEEGHSFMYTERPPEITHQISDLNTLSEGLRCFRAIRGGENNAEILKIESITAYTLKRYPFCDENGDLCAIFKKEDPEGEYFAIDLIASFGLAPYPDCSWEQNAVLIEESVAREFYPHLFSAPR